MKRSEMARRAAELEKWQDAFSEATLRRGQRYVAEGRVRLGEAVGGYVISHCHGSEDMLYQQRIALNAGPQGRFALEGRCSCPVSGPCKHMAAALFALAAEHSAAQGKAGELTPDLQRWLNTLTQSGAASAGQQDRRGRMLCYQLSQDDHGLTLRVCKATRDEAGLLKFGRMTPLLDLLYDPPSYVRPDDLALLRQLSGQPRQYGRDHHYGLTPTEGAELLQRALATGRLMFMESGVMLQPGEVQRAAFRWVRMDDGHYRGQWHTEDGPLTHVLPLIPLQYLDLAQARLGEIEHGLEPHTAVQLSLAPDVPEHLVVPLSHGLNALNQRLPTPTSVEEQHLEGIAPVVHLTLGSLAFSAYMPKSGRMQRQLQHRAALAFDYDGVRATGPADRPLNRLVGRTSQRIARDTAAEQHARDRLRRYGFKAATRQSKAVPESAGEPYELPNEDAWLQFVQHDLASLRDAGWQIEIQRDFAFDLHAVQDWYAQIDEGPGHEWFDLELGIVVDGQRHSLLPIVLQLLRSHPELLRPSELARRGDDEQLLVDLNQQRLDSPALRVALPYGRLKGVMRTLGDLYLHEDASGPSVRLPRADAARLNEVEDVQLRWEGGAEVRALATRLRDAQHLEVPPPATLQATLRPYQQQGLNWLQTLRELGTGGILGDDMGLGKTLQTLAHILVEKATGRLQHPALIVMPTSLVPNWLDEAERFAPDLRVLTLQGPGRSQHFAHLASYDLVLTTYALVPRDLEALRSQPWHLLVLDEAQHIKTSTSKAAQALRQLEATQRLCLSGTPMENHLGELWSLFHFLMPGWLGDQKAFTQQYRTPIERHGDQARMAHLVARVRPFLLRRTKEQVARELPPKTEMVQWVDLSDAQRDTYEAVRVAMDRKVRDQVSRNGAARSQIVILDALLKLRQVCCDLRLVKGAEVQANVADKGKLGALLELLDQLLGENRKVLVFSQFTSMLALIEAELVKREIRYSLLTGDTRDRRAPVQQFQTGDSQVFLISLKAGGTGLNLTAADTVIHYDPWWNPASEQQATDRAYRIGQDKPVFVYKLITRGTVEEKIQQLQRDKAALAAGLLDGGDSTQWRLGDEEIEALFAPLPNKRGR